MATLSWSLLGALSLVAGCLGTDPDPVAGVELDLGEQPSPAAFVDSFVAQDGTARYIVRHGDDSMELFMDASYDRDCLGSHTIGRIDLSLAQDPWPNESGATSQRAFEQSDPPYDNGCGPIAARNLLNWYGVCVDWNTLGGEMHVNAIAPGVRSPDVAGSLMNHAPPGYSLVYENRNGGIDRILRPLSEGHPVIALINTARHMDHYVVVTGVFRGSSNEVRLRLANNPFVGEDMSWTSFLHRWSLVDFGDSIENGFRDEIIGDRPYTMMYFTKDGGSPWTAMLPANACDTMAATFWPGVEPKFVLKTPLFCYYRDLGSCRAGQGGAEGCFDDQYRAGAQCPTGYDCQLADMNRDGRDDLVAFAHGPRGGPSAVKVSLSNGTGFGAPTTWSGSLCYNDEVCKLADVDRDGRADLVAFNRGTQGDVAVALSSGSSLGTSQKWHDSFCYGDEVCEVGDVNGDGFADVVAFNRANGDVWVATSNGAGFIGTGIKWHDSFCYRDELCRVGDVNGDGRADVVAFDRANGDVWAATSSGFFFDGTGVKWHDSFCYGSDQCELADADGDGDADAVRYIPGSAAVYVAISNGARLVGNTRWHEAFGRSQLFRVGDVNGDGRSDIMTWVSATGDIWLSASVED